MVLYRQNIAVQYLVQLIIKNKGIQMQAITYSSARANLASMMSHVCEDHDPVIITRKNNEAVVMLSLEDYESLCETNYLLKSPANAKRLLDSIEELENGKGTVRELL